MNATAEADQYLVERHLAHVASAVEDYRKVYPEPHALSPNLDLAVTGARLLATACTCDAAPAEIGGASHRPGCGEAETTTATVEDAALVIHKTHCDGLTHNRDCPGWGDDYATAEVLADAALLATDRPETTTEWGVRYGDARLLRREVTAWTEAE